MIHIANLHVSIGSQEILKNINLSVAPGTTHALMGPNGSGKSTLAHALIGDPSYTISAGTIFFDGQDITALAPDQRARRGIFLSFQQPPAIPGVSVLSFLYEAYRACSGNKIEYADFLVHVDQAVDALSLRKDLVLRMLNDGFSGGEKKQFEMLQILLFKPKVIIFDEIDSGLDIDALRSVAAAIANVRLENPTLIVVIITHYQRILQYMVPDQVHILCDGTVVQSGNYQLVDELEKKGYDAYRVACR